jgi:type II secretory pathway pseudopilin PulG
MDLDQLMNNVVILPRRKRRSLAAFTLAEVAIAISIVGIVCGGMITGYVQTTRRAQWTAYSLAAQALNNRELEQARAARWDIRSTPAVDETITIPSTSVAILDLPVHGEPIWATNYYSVSLLTVSSNPTVRVKAVRVDTIWPFGTQFFTNTAVTYRAPDQ